MEDLYLDHGELEPHDVKIYIGGVGPRMLRLAGGIADGVVLNNYQTVDAVKRGMAEIKAGADAAGRSMDDIERVKLLLVRMTRNKKAALQAIKPRLAQYLAQQPHIEGPSGADPELSERLRATIPWPATYQQCVEGGNLVSDELVESLVCCGDPDEVRARIAEYTEAGVTVPIVSSPNRAAIDFMAQGF
jgi:5,10-methylenetetrahydromethanopterin reductase